MGCGTRGNRCVAKHTKLEVEVLTQQDDSLVDLTEGIHVLKVEVD